MNKNLSILSPDVCSFVLNNEVSEKVTYLNVPLNVSLDDLKADIKLGANQFEELARLVEKEHEPRYIVITTYNLEQGYMAVSYLQAAFIHKHGKVFGDDEVYNSNKCKCETWEENPFQIPIINETDLKQRIYNFNNSFSFGNSFALGNPMVIQKNPYWVQCQENAVCVVCEDSTGGFAPLMNEDNALYEGLNLFSKNEKVYILNAKTGYINNSFDEEDYFFESDDYRSKWNYIVLSYAADEVTVEFKKNVEKKYYKLLISSVIDKMKLEIQKGFSVERIANLVLKMKEKNKCKLIENIVSYAIKDKNADEKILSNKDFAFMDRFVRCEKGKNTEKNTDKKERAREILQEKLIGLDSVKEQVLNVVNVMKYNQIRAKMNIDGSEYHNVHMMLGAPGTAKTTVAKLMGQIMLEEKLLPDNRFTCVNGAELKGKYIGHSAPRTKALFEENDIIVIDEAYSIVSDNGQNDSFSREAISQLIIEIENHSTDKLIIFAGYGGNKVTEKNNKMKDFLDANPGIKSRITSTIYFDSYSADEMVDIFFKIAQNQNYNIENSAREIIKKHFLMRIDDENFGNGREARSLLETTIIFTAKRLFSKDKKMYTKEEMQTITYEDVQMAIEYVQNVENIQNSFRKRNAIGF